MERGQVLERMTIIEGGEGPLEALYQGGGLSRPDASKPAVLLVPPHPRLLGNADAAVLGEIVWQLGLAGMPTIRFNYRGVGASAGVIRLPPLFELDRDATPDVELGLADLVADTRSALSHLRATWPGPIRMVGYSVGGVVADLLADDADLPSIAVSPAWHRLPRKSLRQTTAAVVAQEDISLRLVCQAYGCQPMIIEGATVSYGRGLPAMARAVRLLCGAEESL